MKKYILFSVIITILIRVGTNHSVDSNLLLTFYDVGQGDAILITYKNDKQILIDGGPSYEIDRLLRRKYLVNNCKIDVLILTHPHNDHLKGLNRIIDHCVVNKVVSNTVSYESAAYEKWNSRLGSVDMTIVGNNLEVGGITLYVIWPNEEYLNDFNDVNDTSIVLLLKYRDFEALLTGDVEIEGIKRVDVDSLVELIEGKLDVYKVPHHGSNGSHHEGFLDNFTLDTCIIMSGENSYGLPNKEVIEDLESRGCDVRRTDKEGDINIKVQ